MQKIRLLLVFKHLNPFSLVGLVKKAFSFGESLFCFIRRKPRVFLYRMRGNCAKTCLLYLFAVLKPEYDCFGEWV